jgi:long-chain-fatty-acid--CoA ligase ACSBG
MPQDKPVDETEWKIWTWAEYLTDVRRFAKTLIHLGVEPFRIINILGFNSPEWFIANCGAVFAGGIAAGIYATNLPDACKYISDHSKAPVVIVDGNKQLKKYTQISHQLPELRAIAVYGEDVDRALASQCAVQVYSWDEFIELGRDVPDQEVDSRSQIPRAGNCASLIYTSGTTGPPKAVMISHDNVTWTAANVVHRVFPYLNETDRVISYLPLSHIAAQLIDIYGGMATGWAVYFAQPDALKGSLGKTMVEVKPTFFFGVPRVWEKIYEKMQEISSRTTGIKRDIARWAKSLGTAKTDAHQFGGRGGAPCGFGCASAVVLGKIKQALGLDRCKACFTAAAPISVDVLNYFASLDIPVYEVFGQSECTGPHTVSVPGAWRIGYCGRPMEGTESIIVPETGELCYRGRHIFMGYMYMPDATAQTIDPEGFLHSGDVAEFDNNTHPNVPPPSGFMRITGRIKELIITAGGENIPPVLIEQDMKTAMPAIANCMVIGDKRKFLTILLTLMVEVDEDGIPSNRLTGLSLETSRKIGSNATTTAEARNCPHWQKYFDDGVKAANSKTTSNAQIVQKWALLDTDFSEKGGELTPTLKLKRSVAAAKYEDVINQLYA